MPIPVQAIFRSVLLRRIAAALVVIPLCLLAARFLLGRKMEQIKNPPGTKTAAADYSDPEGDFALEFPDKYFLTIAPPPGGGQPRPQGSFRTGSGMMLTAISLPLPDDFGFDYAAAAGEIFKGRPADCLDPAEAVPFCTSELSPVTGEEGFLSVRRLFFGRRSMLLLTATGKGLRTADPDFERLSATVKSSWVPVKADATGFRVYPKGHSVGVVFPGKPELKFSPGPGWRTLRYRYAAPDGNVYVATFMSRAGARLTPAEFKRGWEAQLSGKTVAEQSCRGGAFQIDCSAEFLADSGASARMRYVGAGRGVVVLGGEAGPGDACAAAFSSFLASPFLQ